MAVGTRGGGVAAALAARGPQGAGVIPLHATAGAELLIAFVLCGAYVTASVLQALVAARVRLWCGAGR